MQVTPLNAPIQLSGAALDDDLNLLDVNVATVMQLYEWAHDNDPLAHAPGPSKNSCKALVAGIVRYLSPVRFVSKDLESRYARWSLMQSIATVRLSVGAVNLLFFCLFVDLYAANPHPLNVEHTTQLATMAILQLISAVMLWGQNWPRFCSIETRYNIGALFCALAAAVLGSFATVRYNEATASQQYFPGYVSFGVQVALVLFVGDALRLQVTAFLFTMLFTHGCWLLFLLRLQDEVPPILLLTCVPIIVLLKARNVFQAHVSRRFEFQLHLRLVRHITQLKESEQALTEQRIRTAKATAARETHQAIMGYACHELRNPLHGLRSCLRELQAVAAVGHAIDAADVWNLESIDAAVEQMTRVTDDVLDFGKLQAGKLQVGSAPVEIRTIVQRVAVQYRADQSTIDVDIDASVPATILSDPLRIAQVLTNGVTNALKHSIPGKPIKIVGTMKEGFIQVEVHNQGHGLRGINVNNLFQLYERGQDETSSIRGVGLGLPICKMLMSLLDGDIGLEDRGPITVFWFKLPLRGHTVAGDVRLLVDTRLPGITTATGDQPGTMQFPPTPLASTKHAPPLATANRAYWGRKVPSKSCLRRLLVVDDELVNRRVLMRMLNSLGYEATELMDGDEVLPLLQSGQAVDLCLMDIHMVRSDGRDIVRHLRSLAYDLPVIATTGNCSTHDVAEYAEAGFDGMLGKPFSKEDLCDIFLSVVAAPAHHNLRCSSSQDLLDLV